MSRATVLVLGEFDGMHLGHQRLIATATTFAERTGTHCEAVVFDVERRERVLTNPTERARQLLGGGLSSARVLNIPAALVGADQLARQIIAACEPAVVVMACAPETIDDHRYPDLIAAFRGHGLDVVEVERVRDVHGIVSSGRVRSALDTGDAGSAGRLLGRPYSVDGVVRRGQQLGRTIGFPTANLAPPARRVLPANGVYAARVILADGRRVDAAVNVGVRPTVESDGCKLVEAHLLDFDGDLYDQRLTVSFVARLREERRFEGLDALTAQLQRDVASTRAVLAADALEAWFGS